VIIRKLWQYLGTHSYLELPEQNRAHERQVGEHEKGPDEAPQCERRSPVDSSRAARVVSAGGGLPPKDNGPEDRQQGGQHCRPQRGERHGPRRDGHLRLVFVLLLSLPLLVVVLVFRIVLGR
jgi:hypothetical protein